MEAVHIIKRNIFFSAQRWFNVSRNRKIQKQKWLPDRNVPEQFFPQSKIRAGGRTDYNIAVWQKVHAFSIMNAAASYRNTHHTTAVLTDSYRYICPCIPQSLRCNFSHFTISDHHADFSMHIISLLFQVTDRLMDNRWISMCKWCFCLDFLSGCNGHAKKDFQCTICRKMFPCKVQCIFNLRQDLIFTQNLRFQSSCQIKKMFYSLTVCS